jgi:di/tricarboxylate transporter
MSIEGYLVLGLLVAMLVALAKELLRPGIIVLCAAILLMASGIISTSDFLSGFSNKGMLTVFLLFFVSEGVRQTGALNILASIMLPKKKGWLPAMLVKMMIPVTVLSSVLNNTPVVIIFAPMVKKWADKQRIPASKFLIPLSYATIFGGLCTLIGTSTNLVVHGLMLDNGFDGLGMFELGKVGIFAALAGLIYVSLLGPLLLPGKKNKDKQYSIDKRKYYYNVYIPEKSQFIGRQISHGHFPDNRDIFVTIIERSGQSIDVSGGETELCANDKLVIWGNEQILDQLISIEGIDIEDYESIDPWFKTQKHSTIELVVSDQFPGLDKTLKEFNFYQHYRAMVAAIQRNGQKITTHTGNVQLRPGDCLLVLATDNFVERWKGRRDFYLISKTGEVEAPQAKPRIWFALALAFSMVIGSAFGEMLPPVNGLQIDMFFMAAIVSVIMFATKIIAAKNYTQPVGWDVLITIAGALAISKGVQNSGLADFLAFSLIDTAKNMGPLAVLAAIYLITSVFTELITNNAAVAIMFPIAMSAAGQMELSAMPFFVSICIAASASFATPIGYQTNLIVQGIGEYKFRDYLIIGLPLNIVFMLVSIALIPVFWPF